jgi:ATP-binding cassette subfamily C (CFTR/MRP) protein 1
MQLTLAPTSIGRPAAKGPEAPTGHISAMRAFAIYTRHGNYLLVGICFLFFLAAQTTRQVSDFWVRWWVNDEYRHYPAKGVQYAPATKYYALMYLMLIGIFYLMMLCRGSTFLWWVLRSSENLRRKALHNVLNAPMGFFLVTPVGDLLLNFTKDQVRS